ncbi:MAG: helix-turn-helix domain-containing protein [Ilumatobacter sp.]|uniref:helix-turn-helix domain-containing protein n=1 Tax=Ilumatobacter sp. TaxID=1967498 RepID=UPI0039199F7B
MSRRAANLNNRSPAADAAVHGVPTDETPVRPLLVSIEGAAQILAVGRTSVYQLVWSGELEPIRIGRCLRFRVTQLEEFVAERAGL